MSSGRSEQCCQHLFGNMNSLLPVLCFLYSQHLHVINKMWIHAHTYNIWFQVYKNGIFLRGTYVCWRAWIGLYVVVPSSLFSIMTVWVCLCGGVFTWKSASMTLLFLLLKETFVLKSERMPWWAVWTLATDDERLGICTRTMKRAFLYFINLPNISLQV